MTKAGADLTEFAHKLEQRKVGLRREINKALAAGALLVEGTAKESIQAGGKGEVYESTFRMINGRPVPYGSRADEPNLSPKHQASAPGDAPATDTGHLVNQIAVDAVKESGRDAYVIVRSQAKYSNALEFGTRHIEPRPFMAPALQKNADKIVRFVRFAINKGLADG